MAQLPYTDVTAPPTHLSQDLSPQPAGPMSGVASRPLRVGANVGGQCLQGE